MKRWATHLFIASYLSVLGFGFAAHALSFLKTAHPAMYFIVWDMFCGWSSYEIRFHVIGEGDSGRFYSLAPGPWGEFIPYGSAQRHDYDVYGNYGYRVASNTLAQTEHEPIRRIMLVEEAWSKKYNLGADLWAERYGVPKPESHRSYYHVRRTWNADGETLGQTGTLLNAELETFVLDNPKLRADMQRGQTYYATNPQSRQPDMIQRVGFETEAP